MGRAILVTGVSGSGKSTVCTELQRRGYTAYDIEDRDGLFTMIDAETGEPFEEFDPNDLAMVKRSEWICDPDALEALLEESRVNETTFCCGTASNMGDIRPLFDDVILLTVGAEELRERLRARENNPFGKNPEVQDWVLSWKDGWEEELVEHGATMVDADRPVEDTVDAILEHVNG